MALFSWYSAENRNQQTSNFHYKTKDCTKNVGMWPTAKVLDHQILYNTQHTSTKTLTTDNITIELSDYKYS